MKIMIFRDKKFGLEHLTILLLIYSADSLAGEHLASVYWAGPDHRYENVDSRALKVFFFKEAGVWKGFDPKQGLFNKRASDGLTFLFTGSRSAAAKEFHWTMFLDGKSLGQVTTKWTRSFKNSNSPRLHDVLSVKAKSKLPRRWILLSSRTDITDPQAWKVQKEHSKAENLAKDKFLQLYPEEYRCLDNSDGYGGSEKTGKALKVSDLQIQKIYRSNDGQFLVGVQKKAHCLEDYYSTSDHWLLNWIHVDKNHNSKLTNVDGNLVDAADLDGDGFSELIFVREYTGNPIFSLVSLNPESEVVCCSAYSEPGAEGF